MAEEYEKTSPAEGQRASVLSSLPKTLEEEQRALADLARAQEPLSGKRFQLHAANALYLAQEAYERKAAHTGGVDSKLPKVSHDKAVRSLMNSEYFRRFCENQKSAEGMAKLFEGKPGAMNALRQFGAAIRQVERERSVQQSGASQPEYQNTAEGPVRGM